MTRIPIYLDCDTGIDDALTIAYLLSRHDVDLVGVGSVSGNLAAADGARNTLDLLALGGRPDVPVAVGAHDPLVGRFHGVADWVHGRNGIGEVELPRSPSDPVRLSAVELLLRLSREYEGSLHILAVGPLTNLALALRADAHLAQRVAGVTIMGGAAMVPGNITPLAEANIGNDPEAAAAVFDAHWSVTMVGLDVTMEARFEMEHQQRLLASASPVSQAVGRMLDTYFTFYESIFGRRMCALHDPLAAAIAIGAVKLPVAPVVPVVVDATKGPGRGQTIADLRGRFAGYPYIDGARHRVALVAEPGFADALADAIAGLPA